MSPAKPYEPNNADVSFFLSLFDHLQDFQCDEVITGGDFNLVFDLNIDKKGGLAKHILKQLKKLKIYVPNLIR